jgi:hypothetical protein
MSVHCDDSNFVKRAKAILEETGAEDISSTGEPSVSPSTVQLATIVNAISGAASFSLRCLDTSAWCRGIFSKKQKTTAGVVSHRRSRRSFLSGSTSSGLRRIRNRHRGERIAEPPRLHEAAAEVPTVPESRHRRFHPSGDNRQSKHDWDLAPRPAAPRLPVEARS